MSAKQTKPGEAKQYLGVDFQPVPARHSLLLKIFLTVGFIALGSVFLAVALTSLAHRVILEPLIPMDQLEAVQRSIILVLFAVGAVTVGISALTAWLLSRHLTQPIRALMKAMRQVFRSDLEAKVIVNRHDEIGSLGTFFNSMVDKLRRGQAREKAISELKSQFVSVAAHQLRTPLTGLKWSLRWLLDEKGGPLTDKQQETVNQQLKAASQMITMVNELLNVAVVEEGKFGYDLREVEIEKLVKETVQGFAQPAQAREVTVAVKSHVRPQLAVIADPVRLKLALSNLIDNAVRYTPAGGHVTVELRQDNDWLTVKVSDTGIGIPEAERAKLFTKFFRASNAQRLQPDGSGLGLVIVHNVVAGHGGKITVDSTEGKGTTFTFTLPLRRELIPPETFEEGVAAI